MNISQDEFISKLNDALSGDGLTQYRLAKNSGVSQTAISRIRRRAMPLTLKAAQKLGAQLGYRPVLSLTFEPIRTASDEIGAAMERAA